MIDLTRDPLTEIKRFNLEKILDSEEIIVNFVSIFSFKKFFILTLSGVIYEINFKKELLRKVKLKKNYPDEQFNLLNKNLLENYLIAVSYRNHEESGDLSGRKFFCTTYLRLVYVADLKLVISDKQVVMNSPVLDDIIVASSFDSFLDKKSIYPLFCGITKYDANFFTFYVQNDKLIKSILPHSILRKSSTGGVMNWSRLSGMKFVVFTKNGFVIVLRRKLNDSGI